MKTGMAAALSAALALSALLSGCVEEAKTGPAAKGPLTADTNLIKEGRDLRFELKETDELVSPSWQVGEWFGHHVFFEGGPAAGLHINTIVTEERSDGWFLAADDKQIAKIEAAFDIPILGPIKKDLSTTAFGGDWNLYDFPLKVGKTWKRTLVTDFEDPANSKINSETCCSCCNQSSCSY